jgi:hypothetical protein
LAAEVIAAIAPAPEVDPELHLLRSHRPAQASRLFVGHGAWPLPSPPTTRLRRAVPPPRSGEGLAFNGSGSERTPPLNARSGADA